MEVEIFVGERGQWVVVKYPERTAENDSISEMLMEAEDERGDTVDLAIFPPGLHKVRAVVHEEFEGDVWLDFEPIA